MAMAMPWAPKLRAGALEALRGPEDARMAAAPRWRTAMPLTCGILAAEARPAGGTWLAVGTRVPTAIVGRMSWRNNEQHDTQALHIMYVFFVVTFPAALPRHSLQEAVRQLRGVTSHADRATVESCFGNCAKTEQDNPLAVSLIVTITIEEINWKMRHQAVKLECSLGRVGFEGHLMRGADAAAMKDQQERMHHTWIWESAVINGEASYELPTVNNVREDTTKRFGKDLMDPKGVRPLGWMMSNLMSMRLRP